MELSSLNSYCVRGSVLSLSADLNISCAHFGLVVLSIYGIYFGCSGLFDREGGFRFLAFESRESWNAGNKVFFLIKG